MLTALQKFFIPHFITSRSEDNEEAYLFMKLHVAAFFAACSHLSIILILIFSRDHIPILYGLNIFSLVVYLISVICIRRRKYALGGALIGIEVSIYTLACMLYIGTDSYVIFYLFVVLIMQLVIPYAGLLIRGLIMVGIWLALMGAVYIGNYWVPMINLGTSKMVISIFNVNVGFLGVFLELYVDNIVKRLMDVYNNNQLSELRHQTFTDPLTGLFNRRYADNFFEQLSIANEPVKKCVAILDIDDFKQINDTYGHNIGDDVLIWLAEFIKATLRHSDVVIRWGGEEFLLILDNVDEKIAFTVLDNLRKKLLKSTIMVGQHKLSIRATIGVARLDAFNIEKSIEESDKRLYLGKSTGKNRVVISS